MLRRSEGEESPQSLRRAMSRALNRSVVERIGLVAVAVEQAVVADHVVDFRRALDAALDEADVRGVVGRDAVRVPNREVVVTGIEHGLTDRVAEVARRLVVQQAVLREAVRQEPRDGAEVRALLELEDRALG